jgi:hypothetical protein
MNLIIKIDDIKLENILFLDTKENIIMEGNFTKIIYSNESFMMNGIYLDLSINIFNIEKIMNKDYYRFNPLYPENINLIKKISKLENQLLEYYKNNFHISSKINYLLSKQLHFGNLKIFKEYTKNNIEIKEKKNNYILKISGIWENYNEFGITYKLLEI